MKYLLTKILEPKDNAPEAAFILAKLLGAKISQTTFETEIQEHPNYPNFLSVSDVLKHHGIDNIIAKFDRDKIADLPTPFVTQITRPKSGLQYIVVKEISDSHVTFFDPLKQSWVNNDIRDFLKDISNIVLLAEAEDNIVEKGYSAKILEELRAKRSKYALTFIIPLLFFVLTLISFKDEGISALLPVLFTLLTLIGTVVTILLLWYEVDQDNPALKQICTAGKKTNCGAILESKGAKIFGVSWSTIGFVYFSGSLVILLLSGITNRNVLMVLSYLNLAAVPYVFYSIYYQWKIAKQWCVLCLATQALLVFQCIICFTSNWHVISLIENDNVLVFFIQILLSFVIPYITVSILLPTLRKAKESDRTALELKRMKHDSEIFNAVLEKQRLLVDNTDGLGIVLGNPQAKNKIIKVCNPYCGPCASAHTPMEELLMNNPELQLQIIFTATNDPEDRRSHPVKHLLAIDEKESGQKTDQALSDWYLAENKNYEDFASKYPMNGELKKQDTKIEAMREWCDRAEIHFTPTFFINGYQLPPNYTVNDLKYFLSV